MSEPSVTGGARARVARSLPLLLTLLTATALQARMLLLVRRYAVNILFYDQWDYYDPLFAGGSVKDFFLTQNGPVRQGVGFLVYKYVSELSGWNTRVEGLVVSFIVFAALLGALVLRRRLFGPLTFWDALVPALFLNPMLTGSYTYIPNPSHGPFPLLLVVLYCLAWRWRSPWRYAAVVFVNFLLIYTTFGILVGLITPPLLALEAWRAGRGEGSWRAASAPFAALLLSLGSLALFFVDYHFTPAVGCFHFPHERPLEYVKFVGMMFATYWRTAGLGALAYVIGVPLALLVAVTSARHALLLLLDRAADRRASIVIMTLGGFSFLFAAAAAVGRVCLGAQEARSSRYVAYAIPAALALYFELLSLKGRPRLRVAGFAAFAVGTLLLVAPMVGGGATALEDARRGKAEWRRCYIETERIEGCDARAGFKLYSAPESPALKAKLDYLKQHRLNLYAGD